MAKPDLLSIPPFYRKYVEGVEEEELIPALINSGNITIDLIKSIPEASGNYRYAEGKWSIKEVLVHMIDAERIFAYRALRFGRNDKTELPGFEENDYAVASNAGERKLYKILEEYNNVRAATIDLFSSFNEEALARTGFANGSEMSVYAIGFVVAGHETHHRNVLNERYFSK
ncbi:DinB family protein [Fulvivirga kasyanovii]|uniref:DinB family protein n=1 Tax=Fulvivirga kasyanovii TaxID=396812 RepID=A0ABW9RZR0_9BACT|nr:DinB family protein [Fulvivirga kasyanovii]MTI28788.1 DinB family protein [Fulvivirga kasyanovii]